MADIRDLNISDLRDFLSANQIYHYNGFLLSNNNDIYDVAFNLMKDKNAKYDDVPISIIEWMLARNALIKKINVPSYTRTQIKNLKFDDLNNLAKLLGLTKNNVDNVINILHYMHKLKESELDFEMYTDLYTSLLVTSNFETIIKLLKSKSSLKNEISEVFDNILIYNKGIPDFYNKTSNFIRSLIDMKEFDLIEKILPIIIEDDDRNYFNLIELFAEKRFLNIYFKYFPNKYRSIFMISVVKALSNKKLSSYYLIYKILDFAVNNENFDMIKAILYKLQIDPIKLRDIYDKYNDSYNIRYRAKFYGIDFLLSEKEKSNLDMLVRKAKELTL